MLRIFALSTIAILTAACSGGDSDQASQAPESTAAETTAAVAEVAASEAALCLDSGPQTPRDISNATGLNAVTFPTAPAFTEMNLCNIHFHKNAEHRGGEFTTYAGNGDGRGFGTGYRFNGSLTRAELAPIGRPVGKSDYTALYPGDTIELHYVHTTAQVEPGPTLGACLSEAIANPQLRVETQVFVLVNDENAADFVELTEVGMVNGFHQALNIPHTTGAPIRYNGSTTGPSFNRKGSPFQVSWSVRPQIMKVSITSVEAWLADNIFEEKYAHGVRNLVVNPMLLSDIE